VVGLRLVVGRRFTDNKLCKAGRIIERVSELQSGKVNYKSGKVNYRELCKAGRITERERGNNSKN
jgi:hypothetical protein